jgi:hypothetical protein
VTTWADRDLPVLYWLQEKPPEHGLLTTNWRRDTSHPDLPGLTEQDVHVSVETLADEGLVSYATQEAEGGGDVLWMQFQVTGSGLQALGEWPVFDVLGTPKELGRLLDALAEMAASDEEEGNLRAAASTARSKGADAADRRVWRAQCGSPVADRLTTTSPTFQSPARLAARVGWRCWCGPARSTALSAEGVAWTRRALCRGSVHASSRKKGLIIVVALTLGVLSWLSARRSVPSGKLEGKMNRRPDEEAYQEGLQAFLTRERSQVIDEFEAIAFQMGSMEMCERIGIGAEERYKGHHHITQLLVRKNLKQCEFAEELVCAIRDGRTGVAIAVTRTLLEGGVELSWAADENLRESPEDRLLRILRRGYEAIAEVGSLPPSEHAVLDEIAERRLKLSPESARNAMEEMDAAELRWGHPVLGQSLQAVRDQLRLRAHELPRTSPVHDRRRRDAHRHESRSHRKGWLRCVGVSSISCGGPRQFCVWPGWTRTQRESSLATQRSGTWPIASCGESSVRPSTSSVRPETMAKQRSRNEVPGGRVSCGSSAERPDNITTRHRMPIQDGDHLPRDGPGRKSDPPRCWRLLPILRRPIAAWAAQKEKCPEYEFSGAPAETPRSVTRTRCE